LYKNKKMYEVFILFFIKTKTRTNNVYSNIHSGTSGKPKPMLLFLDKSSGCSSLLKNVRKNVTNVDDNENMQGKKEE